MNAAFRADWVRLWHLVQRVEAATGDGFVDIGLRLVDPAEPPQDGGYRTSPANAIMFAGTGGDGVHFSVLTPAAGSPAAAPVVMTAPMAFDSPNHIVAGDLMEFLALGCQTAYYNLDHLAYPWGRSAMMARLQTARLAPGTDGAHLLQPLIDEFDLRPWPDVERRLDELDAAYRGDIQLR
ncbi:hypothetical protein ACFPIJ_43885 [Dactylosporangium cerinum]|uniref:Suppressor of fused-like domain-containing protein n=1 Tax=Dactylosporangium cerinum TaxID=1434730 RepID=A0ABV9WBW9_9ACTN